MAQLAKSGAHVIGWNDRTPELMPMLAAVHYQERASKNCLRTITPLNSNSFAQQSANFVH